MTITVIGAGYVGLVTAVVFSELGNKVFCIDVDKKRISLLKNGQPPFYEPRLEELLQNNLAKKKLIFTDSYKDSVPKSQIVLICVGTPPKNNGEADLSYLFSAVEETAKNLKSYTVIAIKSTIPVGFEDDLENTAKRFAKSKFEFASCPEFLREGSAIEDSFHPDRIVIGASSEKAQKTLLELHAPISGERIICDIRSAQLIKYASNAMLAAKISFANAVADICERTGADVEKVLGGVGADKRIGRQFLYPGVGYGGSCLPKDVQAFIATARQFDYNFDFLRAVQEINEGQIEKFVSKVRAALSAQESKGKDLTGKRIAVLGLSFKPNTDDLRDAPSIKIISKLLDLGAEINAYDPKAMKSAQKILPQKVRFSKDPYEAAVYADAVLLITEWDEFKEMDFEKLKKAVASPLLIDGRNIFDKSKLQKLGFTYIGVGR